MYTKAFLAAQCVEGNKIETSGQASAPGRNSRNERPPRRGRASHTAGRNSEKIQPDMSALFAQAIKENLWFHCAYQDLWFSPQELYKNQQQGRFKWSAENWTLKDPALKIRALKEKAQEAQEELARFYARMASEKQEAQQ